MSFMKAANWPEDKLPTIDGHDFQCEDCRQMFIVPFEDYHGQFDHPPSVPICDECADPTPWCNCCGAKERTRCKCGPIAKND
jgi:hypothetical protein